MVLTFCQWLENSSLGWTIRDSTWLFPAIEAIHLIALAMIGGAVLIVDLKLLGVGLRRQPAWQLADEAKPWLVSSLAVMIVSGVALFSSEATKCYATPAFWYKMTALAAATLFTFTARASVLRSNSLRAGTTLAGRTVAVLSLSLWSIVGVSGRAIGFY